MNFVNAPGFKTIYYVILVLLLVAILKGLVQSAIHSWKRTGGKLTSVLDEAVIGFFVIVAFIMFAQLSPDTVITWLMKPLAWLWDMLLQLLRFVGVPV